MLSGLVLKLELWLDPPEVLRVMNSAPCDHLGHIQVVYRGLGQVSVYSGLGHAPAPLKVLLNTFPLSFISSIQSGTTSK